MTNGFLQPFKVWIGEVASATGAGVVTGLPFTPDFVIFQQKDEANDNTLSWTYSSTTGLTLTGRSTTTATSISFLAAKVS